MFWEQEFLNGIFIIAKWGILLIKQACAAEIAVLYAALICKQNKRYRTSARLTKTPNRCSNVNNHGTDGQTDRQTECDAICGPLLGRRAA